MGRRNQGASRMQPSEPRSFPWGWMVGIAMAVGLVGAGVWGQQQLADPQLMPLNNIRVDTPLNEVSPQQLREIVLAHADAGFLYLNVAAVRRDLEALPWVRQATVRRAWPDVLVVSIQEQKAMARWASGGLLNTDGEHFFPQGAEDRQDLPLLRGPTGTEKVMLQQYRKMQAMLGPLGLPIRHISLDERRAWTMQVGDTMHVGLGRSDVERRLLRFVRVYPHVLEPRLPAIESIDMRYTNGFAIRWREGLAPTAA